QAVSEHHHFVEERLDWPRLLLKTGCAGTQDERAAAPFLGGHDRRDAGLLADDAAQEELEIGFSIGRHRRTCPFAFADNGEGRAVGARPRAWTAWSGRVATATSWALAVAEHHVPIRSAGRQTDPPAAAVIVFTVTVAAVHA